MPLPASGNSISLSQVNTELGRASTTTISINEINVRRLFIVSQTSGTTIAMSSGFSKSIIHEMTFTQTEIINASRNLRTLAVNSKGWDQWRRLKATSSTAINSDSTGTWAMRVEGDFPNNVDLIVATNTGIYGMGGAGGAGRSSGGGGAAGAPGGGALWLAPNSGQTVFITNNSTIAGGGGGGGAGASATRSYVVDNGEGGSTNVTDTFAGGGGGGGQSNASWFSSGGAGGGGSPGSVVSLGTTYRGGFGGSGGSWGSGGSSGGGVLNTTLQHAALAAGGAGQAAFKNSGTISWVVAGTRLGTFPAS